MNLVLVIFRTVVFDRKFIEDEHNRIRSNVTPTAANMLKMHYTDSLETEAQIWAENCKLTHEQSYLRFLPGQFTVGQNIVTHTSPMTWDAIIELWYRERSNFTFGSTNNIHSVVGHYTQLVWATTTLVGCGSSKCGSTYFYVCNYGPGGNDGQIAKPYISGASCADCPKNCDSTTKLCGCSVQFCKNGGNLNLTSCDCECNKNVKSYYDKHCDLACDQDGDNSLCGNHPFDKASCASNTQAAINCPWLCDICPYAGKNYTEGSVQLHHNNSTHMEPLGALILVALLIIRIRHEYVL